MSFYGSLEGAAAYHTARGNTAWTGSDELKSAALLRATTWLDAKYGPRFPGCRTAGRSQARQWPRENAFDIEWSPIAADEVPAEVIDATYEAALRELVTPGSLSPDYVASERVKSERVGPIAIEYASNGGASDVRPLLSIVDDLLFSLLGTPCPALVGRTVRAW